MIDVGEWKVAQLGPLCIVIEVLDHVAIAYMWSDETGITGHVWLFNRCDSDPQQGAPRALGPDEILTDQYVVPTRISQIEVTTNPEGSECRISWQGNLRAVLRLGEAVGLSAMVRASNDMAQCLDAALLSDGASA